MVTKAERLEAERWYQLCRAWPAYQDAIPSRSPFYTSGSSSDRPPVTIVSGVWKIRAPSGVVYMETMKTVLNALEPDVQHTILLVRFGGTRSKGPGSLPTSLLIPNTTSWRRSELEIIARHMLEFRAAVMTACGQTAHALA